MAKIEFKGKVRSMYNMDDTLVYQYISVPELDRKHCDMHAFRAHPKYGPYANSDLFKGMLRHIRTATFGRDIVRLDAIPAGVTIDTSGFLAVIRWEV